jgi:polyisoprenyl-teichoic acid--peptidoglycan teichoic acid transferase
MNSKKPSLDGFIPRKPSGAPNRENNTEKKVNNNFFDSVYSIESSHSNELNVKQSSSTGYGSNSFGSLNNDDQFFEKPNKKKTRREKRLQKKRFAKKPRRVVWKIIRFVVSLLIICVIGLGAYAAYRVVSAGGGMFRGSFMDIFKGQPLQEDENGRSNFLIIGTSEDNPGHDGADLTDSIMVASIDQNKKDLFLVSIPRDLEVEYGRACISGYRGKVNAFYACVNQGNTPDEEQKRLDAVRKLIGEVLGMDIQYAVHVNYTVLTDVIDAIGGSITIDIESSDPRGYLDSQLDYQCGETYSERIKNCPPRGHYVDYKNGKTELTSIEALNLSRARGDSEPTYGFASSNFEREKNQRKIIVAIREKALSTGTLTNVSAIMNLIDALGNNLRTNIQSYEIKTLIDLAGDVESSNIYSLDMLGDGILLGNGNPVAGPYKFSGIQQYLLKKLSNDPVIREEAQIIVLNGTSKIGLGQKNADMLKKLGYSIYYVDNAPEGGIYPKTEIYVVGDDCSGTVDALESMFGVAQSLNEAPLKTDARAQIVLIVGDDQVDQD